MQNIGSATARDRDESLGEVKSDIQGTASAIGSQARERVSEVSHRAQEYAQQAQEYGRRALDETVSFIRRHPSQAVMAGFGLGLFIGMAFARR